MKIKNFEWVGSNRQLVHSHHIKWILEVLDVPLAAQLALDTTVLTLDAITGATPVFLLFSGASERLHHVVLLLEDGKALSDVVHQRQVLL